MQFFLLFHFLLFSNLTAEQQIDLWKKDNKNVLNTNEEKKDSDKKNSNFKINKKLYIE